MSNRFYLCLDLHKTVQLKCIYYHLTLHVAVIMAVSSWEALRLGLHEDKSSEEDSAKYKT